MNSRVLFAETTHARLEPAKHSFKYPLYMFSIDLDELELLDKCYAFFGYNKLRPFSIYDRDYLGVEERSLKEKVLSTVGQSEEPISQIILLSTPRYFGYVFNPASFFYCLSKNGSLQAVVLEVNNTFGERHHYVLQQRDHFPKEFYVSPFNSVSGEYALESPVPNGKVDIKLDIIDDNRVVFRSRLWGKTTNLNWKSVRKILVEYPFCASLTTPRIMSQAAKLYYGKKLKVQKKPVASHPHTRIVSKPSFIQRYCLKWFIQVLSRIRHGSLKVVFPDKSSAIFGKGTPSASLAVHDYDFFKQVILQRDMAFGECFTAGTISSPNICEVLSLMAENLEYLDSQHRGVHLVSTLRTAFEHYQRKNSLAGSRRNISSHYDLSNEMFRLFLDESMTYSGAMFEGSEALEEAQERKLKAIIRKAKIAPDHHILEIGCGWGSLAILAAQTTGCRVTGLTLSAEQKRFADDRIKHLGLEEKISIELCDYRNIQGQYDRIVSIEMLEAVGYQFFDSYFSALDRLLSPKGRAVLQVITLPDYRYDKAKRGVDWIQKYIFPGSTIPALSALTTSMKKSSKLVVDDIENIGLDYATTLHHWRERFLGASSEIQALGFDKEFLRAWEYYFSYCEAGFRAGVLSNLQIILRR